MALRSLFYTKFILFYICSIGLQSFTTAQSSSFIDSLEKANQAYILEDSIKINILLDIIEKLMQSNPKRGIMMADEAIRISVKNNARFLEAKANNLKGACLFNQRNVLESIKFVNESANLYKEIGRRDLEASRYSRVAYLWSENGDRNKSIVYNKKAIAIYKELGLINEQARAMSWMARQFGYLGDSSNARQYYMEAIRLNQTINNNLAIITIYNDMSFVYSSNGEFIKAIESSHQALKMCEIIKDSIMKAKIYTSIGNVYTNVNEPYLAIEFYEKALKTSRQFGNELDEAILLNNIGVNYRELKNYTIAYKYLIQSKKIHEKLNSRGELGNCIMNLGTVFHLQKIYKEAISYLNDAKSIFESTNNKYGIATVINDLLICYRQSDKETLQAFGIENSNLNDTLISLAIKGISLCDESSNLQSKWSILYELSLCYERKGEFNNAYNTFAEFVSLRDSVNGDAIKQELKRKAIKYEFDKKEASLVFEKRITIEQLEKQKILSEKQRQDIKIKNQLIIISEDKNEINHLAYLKEKAEKTEKEQRLLLSEKDKQLQASQLDILGNEKKIQLQHLASQKSTIGFLLAGLIVILLSSIVYYLRLQQRQSQKEAIIQSKFTQRLFESTEDERGRIARDLHDGLSHELLTLKRTLASEGLHKNTTTKIDHIINDVRQISRNLHPVMLESLGLKICLDTLCEQYMNSGSLFISHQINYHNILSKPSELQVFRIIQEALNNIIKYAKADAAKLSIETNNNVTEISIQDNGIGFDVNTVLNSGKSFGLISIQQRSKAIGGIAHITSNQNGTLININIPNNIK